MNMNLSLRKNILDLSFQKHLIIASSCFVILSTYLIAVIIAIMTKQIDTNNINSISLLILSSLIILIFFLYFFIKSVKHIKNIPEIILNLE